MAQQFVRFDNVIESVVRVPPFFLVDEILKSSFAFPRLEHSKNGSDLSATEIIDGNIITDFSIMFSLLGFMMTLICCSLISSTVTLNKKELITVYSYLISIFMLYFSYQRNVIFLNYFITTETYIETHPRDAAAFYGIGFALVKIMLMQFCLGFAYEYLNPVVFKYKNWSKIVLIGFLSPSILALMSFPRWFLKVTPFISSLLLLSIPTYTFWSNIHISQSIIEGWRFCRRLTPGSGLPAVGMVLVKWSKLHLTAALRIFWIIRLLNHTINFVVENDLSEHGMDGSFSFYNWNKSIPILLPVSVQMAKSLLSSSCETFIAVIGMASCLSYIFQQISYIFLNILLVDVQRKYFGMITGLIFCILALQTGLTNSTPEKRLVYLTRSFLLLFYLTLHMIHKILDPILVSLSALHKSALCRHVRALLVSAFLILYPAILLVYLWRSDSLSTWLLGVSAFHLKIIVKMTISLTIYFMFVVDSYRKTFWERLDDYVYYIDSFGSTVEFCFGIFLLLNGCWILFYESGSFIRAVAMCFYAYYNIWYVAKAGWTSFLKRRTTVKKIDQLRDATAFELSDLKDVCAICYQSMKAAKITSCRHFFHAICLRKWLYLQDYCPICHQKLYPQEEAKQQPR